MKTKPKTKPRAKRKELGSVAVRGKAGKPVKAAKPSGRAKAFQLLPKKPNGQEILLTSLAVGISGILGYFGWQYYKKKKGEAPVTKLDEELVKIKQPKNDVPIDNPPKEGKPKIKASKTGNDDFPLKKGSKGETVRRLQKALMEKYGNSVLPKYGADGDFGTETLTALKKNGLPVTIDESTFNVITGGNSESEASTAEIVGLAESLYHAAASKSIGTVLSLLSKIKGKDHYQQVSNSFMQHRLNGVRQTLVTGLLNSFPNEATKQKIRMEFLRMGLNYDGSKWSLSGFGGQQIVTREPTKVWVSANKSLPVPANMVLGTEVTQKMDFTLFENNRQYFLVKTQSVKYLK